MRNREIIKKGLAIGIVLIMVTVVFAGVPMNIGAEESTYPEELVSYWKFDDGSGTTASDSSVNDNLGTVYNAEWVDGIVGKALEFSGGGNSYVSVPDSPEIHIYSGDYTLEAWVFPKSRECSPGHRNIIISSRSGYNDGLSFDIIGDDPKTNTKPGDLRLKHYTNGGGSKFESTNTVPLNKWTYVVATYEYTNKIAKLYFNGLLEKTSVLEHMEPYDNGFEISREMFDHNMGIEGIIDEVAIWNIALTEDKILLHYSNGLIGKDYCYIPPIEADIDINPNTLNLKSKGKWVTGYIELPEGYDFKDIDKSTVSLKGDGFEVGGEYGEFQTNCLMMKFDRQELIAELSPGIVELIITGELEDGTIFEGYDIIRVIKKGK